MQAERQLLVNIQLAIYFIPSRCRSSGCTAIILKDSTLAVIFTLITHTHRHCKPLPLMKAVASCRNVWYIKTFGWWLPGSKPSNVKALERSILAIFVPCPRLKIILVASATKEYTILASVLFTPSLIINFAGAESSTIRRHLPGFPDLEMTPNLFIIIPCRSTSKWLALLGRASSVANIHPSYRGAVELNNSSTKLS